jgi:hypothetical protein
MFTNKWDVPKDNININYESKRSIILTLIISNNSEIIIKLKGKFVGSV